MAHGLGGIVVKDVCFSSRKTEWWILMLRRLYVDLRFASHRPSLLSSLVHLIEAVRPLDGV